MAWYNPIDWFQSSDNDSSSTGNRVTPGGKPAPAYDSSNVIDWTARNVFTDSIYEDQLNQISQDDQIKILDQFETGKINTARYLENSGLARQVGSSTYDQNLGKKSFVSLLGTVPWWVWLVLGVGILFYTGGFARLKALLKK